MSAEPACELDAATAPALRGDTLATSVVILFALTIVQRLIGFGRSVLVCRWLDPDELGRWDLAFSFIMMAAPLVVLGVPGSFGRYVEYFRRRGQFGVFLRRATIFTLIMVALASVVLWRFDGAFSQLAFGDLSGSALMGCVAICLTAVVCQNFLISLFTALRVYRVVSGIQFASSVLFAVLSVILLCGWRGDAMAVIVAYGAACLVSSLASLPWLRNVWAQAGEAVDAVGQRTFWGKLLPFAVWLWATNWLTAMFDVADRYMLVHNSGLSPDEALAQVGQYHSARLLPLLFVGLAELMAALVTPHLTHDWEHGRREEVGRRLNLILKTFAFVMTAGAAVVLWIAPWLFSAALGGKFTDGLSVLPMTLCYCLWGAQMSVAQNYLWCAEKARLASASLLVGLLVNVTLNCWWIPLWGLHGAVLGTMAGTATALTLVFSFNRWLGLQADMGVYLASLLPALLCLGPLAAGVFLSAFLLIAACSDRLLSSGEKKAIAATLAGYCEMIEPLLCLLRRALFGAARRRSAR